MLTDLESCPGFLNFFGHLGAQCSSEPHVKQAPFFLSLLKGFLPFFLKSVFCWTPCFPLGLWKLEFFCTKLATEVPSVPFPCESFALEFCSTLRWPMTSSTENSRLWCFRVVGASVPEMDYGKNFQTRDPRRYVNFQSLVFHVGEVASGHEL